MAQPASSAKIEDLRFKVKTDPKSRLFYPLADELRKAGQFAEAEQVLRTGLTSHPTYLSAWVGLGRVLRDQQKHGDAVEALNKGLQLDPGNVVAARLLGDSYLAMGEKIEAIKKYKLVHALLPGDEDLEAVIKRLDTEINAPLTIPEAAQFSAPPAPARDSPFADPPPPEDRTTPLRQGDESRLADSAKRAMPGEQRQEKSTAAAEPMLLAHDESPFEEPGAGEGYGSDAFAIEAPAGMHISNAPLPAEFDAPAPSADEPDIFDAPGEIAPGFVQGSFASNADLAPPGTDDFTRTLTMADLYANQGLIDEARDIYEDILARDPSNAIVRAKIEALGSGSSHDPFSDDGQPEPFSDDYQPDSSPFGEEPALTHEPLATAPASTPAPQRTAAAPPSAPESGSPNPKVERLQSWLARVKRPEDDRV